MIAKRAYQHMLVHRPKWIDLTVIYSGRSRSCEAILKTCPEKVAMFSILGIISEFFTLVSEIKTQRLKKESWFYEGHNLTFSRSGFVIELEARSAESLGCRAQAAGTNLGQVCFSPLQRLTRDFKYETFHDQWIPLMKLQWENKAKEDYKR